MKRLLLPKQWRMAKRVSKLKNANRFFVAADVHPQTLDVVRTRAETFGFDVIVDDADKVLDHQDVFGVLLQQVGTTGEVHDYGTLIAELKSRKVVVSVAADFMALVLLTAPGKQGADIVFGSAQRFGVPMGYGGPHAAFFGAKDEFKRSMPGRIIGVSKDAAGNTALRMAMQTRGAAHPPRESELQYLYLSGAAGKHRQPVRRIPRPGRPEAYCQPHSPPGRYSGLRSAAERP
ncbi:glycine dehydrogenase [Enterobacter asburiae]|uniref:Glycine dehydrogenase n=1 Tax=Enterobacter asburiae TaxID=61645 RepID=A0A376FEI1_ENTAS|nr:glycine dehydrogenase [Enterobacter asburiae]